MQDDIKIKKLIKSCKKQEWAAQKELYLLFADDMMSIAIRYSKDLSSAKDLVQETFLICFNKIEQFNGKKGTFGGWLSRILINKHFAQYRKNKKMIFQGEDVLAGEASNEISVVELLEAEDILKLLDKLPNGCRTIFNLKVIEGYSHKEIGEMLKITPSSSRSQLTRAKKLLRAMLSQKVSYHINTKKSYKSI